MGRDFFLFATAFKPTLGPTQPPIQWVPVALTQSVKRPGREADHSPPSSAEVKNAWSDISTPPYDVTTWCLVKPRYVFMVWYFVKHRDNFFPFSTSTDAIQCTEQTSTALKGTTASHMITYFLWNFNHTMLSNALQTHRMWRLSDGFEFQAGGRLPQVFRCFTHSLYWNPDIAAWNRPRTFPSTVHSHPTTQRYITYAHEASSLIKSRINNTYTHLISCYDMIKCWQCSN
jgi:hypothetical protein